MRPLRAFPWATAYVAIFALTSALFAIAMASAPSTEMARGFLQVSVYVGVAAGVALLVAVGLLVAEGGRRMLDRSRS